MIPAIPLSYKLGALALALALAGAAGYVQGRKSLRGDLDALRASYAAAAAQAKGQAEERERMWTNAAQVAGEKYDARIKAGDDWAAAQLDRMRDAAATGERVRAATETAGGCPAPRGPTQAELLGASREIIELARDADQDRAALEACLAAWPR